MDCLQQVSPLEVNGKLEGLVKALKAELRVELKDELREELQNELTKIHQETVKDVQEIISRGKSFFRSSTCLAYWNSWYPPTFTILMAIYIDHNVGKIFGLSKILTMIL